MIQGDGERNFHVFYYLFAGMSASEKEQLGLTEATDFHYLRGGYRGLTRDVAIDMGACRAPCRAPHRKQTRCSSSSSTLRSSPA